MSQTFRALSPKPTFRLSAIPNGNTSKPFKAFYEALVSQELYKKVSKSHTLGHRIAPPQTDKVDAKHQLRTGAGPLVDGKQEVYLQVSSQAKNDALKKFREKRGTHANLASGRIDLKTDKDQKTTFEVLWKLMEKQAKDNLK